MTIEITQQKPKQIVIGLPSFTKCSNSYYACLNENNVIRVSHYPLGGTTEIAKSHLSMAYEGTTIITKEEFNEAYQATIDRLYDDMEHNIAAINLICEDGGEPSDPAGDEVKFEEKQQA